MFLFGVITSVLCLILVIFSGFIYNILIGEGDHKLVLIIVLISVPFVVTYSLIEAFLRSLQEINMIVKVSIISNIISTLIFIPLIYFYGMLGVAIYLLCFGFLPFSVFIFLNKKRFLNFFVKTKDNLEKYHLNRIYKIGVVSLFSSLLHQGVLILIRRFIINNYGLVEMGVYQSVLSVSVNFFAVIYIFFSTYTLPKISGYKDNSSIVTELNDNFRFLLFIIIPLVAILYTYREFIIFIFFSKEFSKASELLLFQLIGDIFRTSAALFGLWLIPKMKIIQLFMIDFTFNLLLYILPVFLLNYVDKNLYTIPISYMISFFIHFILFFIYSVYFLKFKFDKKTLETLLYSIAFLIICLFISYYFKNIGYYISILILTVWFILIVKKDEKMKLFRLLIRKNIIK